MARQPSGYEISYTKVADKFFSRHEDIRGQYEDAIRKLMTNDHPVSVDLRRVQGKKSNDYRIRIGDYRVVYTIINGRLIVITTLLASSRGDIYKKMGALR